MQLQTKRLETQKKPASSKPPINQNHKNQQTLNQNQNQNQSLPPFPVGSQVEVSSDEEGFKGAWFLATVIKPPPSSQNNNHHNNKIFVEYNNLFAEENGSTLLTEFVDVEYLRPRPPVDEVNEVDYKVNDVVDAYYQDGWWCGVVTEVVLPNSKYKVVFSNPPDELLFAPSDLRLHKSWVRGNWLLPHNQRMRELNFTPGTAVEVNIDPDYSNDVWFPATFIKQLSDNSFLVEYQSSSGAGLQKVAVNSHHIRPSPPITNIKTFSLLEKVDAFCDCCWLSGIVTKILAGGRYIVYFKRTKKEKELPHSELRVHMDWTNKWVHSSQDKSTTSNLDKRLGSAAGGYEEKIRASADSGVMKGNAGQDRISAVTQKNSLNNAQTPGSEKVNYNNVTPSSRRTEKISTNGDTVSLRLSRSSNEEDASGAPLSPVTSKPQVKQTEVLDSGTGNVGQGRISSVTQKHCVNNSQTPGSEKANYNSVTPTNKKTKLVRTNGDTISVRLSRCSNEEVASDAPLSPVTSKPQVKQTKVLDSGIGNIGQGRIAAGTQKNSLNNSLTPGSEKANYKSIMPSNKRTKRTRANGDTISLRLSRSSNEEVASDALLSPVTSKPQVKQTEALDSGIAVNHETSTPVEQGNSSLNQSEDSSQPSDSAELKAPVTRKRGRPRKLQAPVAGAIEKTPTTSDSVKPLASGSIVVGLTYNGKMIDSLAESSEQLLNMGQAAINEEGKNLATSADHHESISGGQKEGVVTNLKRKRGRPPKVLFRLGHPETKEAVAPGSVDNVDKVRQVDIDMVSSDKRPPVNEAKKAIGAVESPAMCESTPSTNSGPRRTRIIGSNSKRLGVSRKVDGRTGRRPGRKHRKVSIAAAMKPANRSILRDAGDTSGGTVAGDPDLVIGGDIDKVVPVISSIASDDDTPLSAWLEGAQSPLSTDGSKMPSDVTGEGQDKNGTPSGAQYKQKVPEESVDTSAGNASQYNDVPKSQDETQGPSTANVPREMPTKSAAIVPRDIPTESTAIVPRDTPVQSSAIVSRENQDLPFVKNSHVWGMIESMEVLQRIPQKPHFLPLFNCKEECREGIAIGSMVTFTSLAERISKVSFDDPKSLLEGYLEALVDLEELGFNVTPLRELLNKLICIKDRHEQGQNTSKEIESQIMERNHAKSKIDDEIADMEKKMAELKGRQALAASKKERKDAEIKMLKSSVDAVKATLEKAREEFERVATSLC